MKQNQKIKISIILLILFISGLGYFVFIKDNSKKEENKGETSTKGDLYNDQEIPKPDEKVEKMQPNVQPESQISEEEKAVRTQITDFQNDYRSKNKNKIFSHFTVAITQEDKDTRERLLNGQDTLGNIGGPILFETNIASEYSESFEFIEIKKDGNIYKVTVREQRKTVSGKTFPKLRTIKLIKSGSNWLIDSYEQPEYSGKFTGFLS